MIDMQSWFKEGKRMTVTVDITDTAKVEELMVTLNKPSPELVAQNGFTVHSFGFQDSNQLVTELAQITKVVIENFIHTSNYELLSSLLGAVDRSTLFFYPELKGTSIREVENALHQHEGKVLSKVDIENIIKGLTDNHG